MGKLWQCSEDTYAASMLPWGEALPALQASTQRPPKGLQTNGGIISLGAEGQGVLTLTL